MQVLVNSLNQEGNYYYLKAVSDTGENSMAHAISPGAGQSATT